MLSLDLLSIIELTIHTIRHVGLSAFVSSAFAIFIDVLYFVDAEFGIYGVHHYLRFWASLGLIVVTFSLSERLIIIISLSPILSISFPGSLHNFSYLYFLQPVCVIVTLIINGTKQLRFLSFFGFLLPQILLSIVILPFLLFFLLLLSLLLLPIFLGLKLF